MKLLFFIIVLLFVAAGVTLYAVDNPGYVLIARAPWSIEMSLTLFILLMIAAFFLLYLLLYLLVRLWRIPRDVGRWRGQMEKTHFDRSSRIAHVHGMNSA